MDAGDFAGVAIFVLGAVEENYSYRRGIDVESDIVWRGRILEVVEVSDPARSKRLVICWVDGRGESEGISREDFGEGWGRASNQMPN